MDRDKIERIKMSYEYYRKADEFFKMSEEEIRSCVQKYLTEMSDAYESVNAHLTKHFEENHGCANCPHKSGWCELPQMKADCARLLAEDRYKWKARAGNLENALNESLKLQSHYAELLNLYDGSKRRKFANVDEWLDRLNELNTTEDKKVLT